MTVDIIQFCISFFFFRSPGFSELTEITHFKIENSFESHTHTHTHAYVKNVKNLENVAKNKKENVTSHPISQR